MSEVRASGTPAIPPAAGVVRRKTLDNGMVVLVGEDHTAPVASVQVWVRTGSIHEGPWMGAGLSHLLEHMIFKGTDKRGPNQIARELQELGGYVNAYTSFDRTVYWVDVPAGGALASLEILADAVLHSTIPAEEFAKEQEVIRREFAMGFDDPNRASSELMLGTLFRQSPYREPVIGHLEVFNRLTREDVAAYHRRRYVPNNMFLVVTGDVDSGEVFAAAEAHFGGALRRALEPVAVLPEPPQLSRREASEDFDTELTRVNLAWHIPPLTHPDTAALDLLAMVLGGGDSAPLTRQLRERSSLVHHVSCYAYTAGEIGVFGVELICDPGKKTAAVEAALCIVEGCRTEEVKPSELEKARKGILAEHFADLATARGRAASIGSGWLLTADPSFGWRYLETLMTQRAGDLQRVAGAYLRPENLTVTSLEPRGLRAGETTAVSAHAAREVQRFLLPNGLRVLVCEEQKLPLVTVQALFRGGLLTESAETNGLTSLMSRCLIKGTARRSAEQIADEIEAVGGQIHTHANANSLGVTVDLMEADTRLGLEVLADVLTGAAFPDNEIARERDYLVAALKAEDEQITSTAQRILRRELFGGHPYGLRSRGTPESLARLGREQLLACRDRTITAANGVLAVGGAVRASDVLRWAGEFFRSLPPGELLLEDPPAAAPLDGDRRVTERQPRQQAVVMTGFRGTTVLSPDRAALELLDTACSDMASRFFTRIREEMGLAYFVGTSHSCGFAPGFFSFYLGTDPAKLDEVMACLHEEIALLGREGLRDDELARAKTKLLGARAIREQSMESFLHGVAADELSGVGCDAHRRRPAEILALTADQVRGVAARYFHQAASVTVVVTPGPDAVETSAEPT